MAVTFEVCEIDIPARTVLIAPDRLCHELELFDARGLRTWDYAEAARGFAGPRGARVTFPVRSYRRAGLQ